jgi:signal transduction histidine kinase/ActR/RegA family two-component response regulator
MIATNVTALEDQRLILQLALDATRLGTFRHVPGGEGSWDETARAIFDLPADARAPGAAHFLEKFVHPDDHELVQTSLSKAMDGERFGPIEYRVRLPGGRTRWVSAVGVTTRDQRGKVTSIVGTLKDETERRALEARLRDAEKLESIGRLAGGVAHDFNNMLTAILGNVAFAASVDSLEEVRPLLEEVRVAAERSAALTAQLLAFARRQVVEPKVLEPNALIRRLEPLLRRLLDERSKMQFSLLAKGRVRFGESQLEQVVMNLVANARDAVAQGGFIEVTTADVPLEVGMLGAESGLAAGDYVRITVRDSGAGIPADALPHLFEPFFTTREGGTGLGLATCYGIVRQGKGTITVESEVGRGATFRVYLPRVSASADAPEAPPKPSERPRKQRVLVVEDEASVRRVLQRILQHGTFEVFVAAHAEEALQLAGEQGPFDLLVSDIVMPGVDGRELARRLKQRWPELRVLLISGYTQEFPLKDHAHDPTLDFLQKPFQPGELLDAIRKLTSPAAGEPK